MSKVLINYKSGRQVEMAVESFTIKIDGHGNKSFSWKSTSKARLRPLLINVDEVESVWEAL